MPYRRADAGRAECIDRSRTLSFTFEGREYTAHPGDTITSALMANGLSLLGRSFKYHRPRGSYSIANHDINALFASSDDTHIRGDVTPVTEGAALQPVNVRGRLATDRDRYLDKFGRFMPVGFYYKAFHRPKSLFPFWERAIRKRAGLGTVDTDWRPNRRAKRYAHCDVLVVGGGPAGLYAALRAAEQNYRVAIVDENARLGGSLNYAFGGDTDARARRAELVERVEAHPAIQVYTRGVALGHYSDHLVPVSQPDGIVKIRARGVVVATGLIEQPAVFRNNDLPGVMLASAAQRLLHCFGVAPCGRAVVLCANAEGLQAAQDMHAAGIEIVAIADMSGAYVNHPTAAVLRKAGVAIHAGYAIYEAHGRDQVTGVTVAPFNDGECDAERGMFYDCDGVISSVGFAPAGHLLYEAGGEFGYDETLAMPVPQNWPDDVVPAGRLNGVFELDAQQADAEHALDRLADAIEGRAASAPNPTRDTNAHGSHWPIVAHPKGRNFVDFDEDLQLKDLKQATLEGFDNIELLKRYSTVGMGPSQGKHSNLNAVRILARERGWSIDATGTTTARPMYHPVRMEDLAGLRLRPTRRTPCHGLHEELDATFMDAGAWERPAYYGRREERERAIESEVRAVRDCAGLIDVSTLGKIEIVGPDTVALLEGAYTMGVADLVPGAGRYAVMTDESGVLVDDGFAACITREHFFVTTSSGHADETKRVLARLALEWNLDVDVVDRTGQVASLTLAGPASREILAPLTDISLAKEDFRSGIREGTVCGASARVLSAGFASALGFELHVGASDAVPVWRQLMTAAGKHGLKPFGVEAQRVLRMERGHLIVGQDTDGLTHPFEVGLTPLVNFDKPFFVGRGALKHFAQHTQRRLVRFMLPPDAPSIPRESHLVIHDGDIAGRVTSTARSPSIGRPIGLAMVDTALAEAGTPLILRIDGGELVEAEQVAKSFFDHAVDKTRSTS